MQVPVPVPWGLSVGDEALATALVTAALGIRPTRVIRKLGNEHSLLAISRRALEETVQ